MSASTCTFAERLNMPVQQMGSLIFLCIHLFVFPNDLNFTVVLMSSTILLNVVTATLIMLQILYH